MRKINICVIGVGRAGMIHARTYLGGVKNAKLIAICDPSADNLRVAKEELGVDYTYTDYKEVLKNDEIDAVVIVTPTNYHREITVAAAKAKKHVFCEKPMAVTEEECDEMIEACNYNNVKLQLGFMRRFDPSFKEAKDLMDNSLIGDITLIKSLTHGPSEPKDWMYDISVSGGPLAEVNSHDFDTLRWYANSEVKWIHAVGRNFRSPEIADKYPDYYDTVAVLMEFENGILGMIDGAQYVQYGYDSRAEVLGTHGNLSIGSQKKLNVELATYDKKITHAAMPSWRELFVEAYKLENQSFINSIIKDTEPEVTGYDGKMALRLVNKGLESLKTGKKIYL
jgi:myo-inositol 2-dehydrogenase / D-chiro-inositol 1-dehydrogenase